MAAGGFKFGQASATYNSSTYSTKREWALDVHRARCDAFFLAQYREGNNWSCVTPPSGTPSTISESRTVESNTYTLHIADMHTTSVDTTGQYPAFITYWQLADEEYAIITSNGTTWYDSYSSTVTHGLYINGAHLSRSAYSNNDRYVYYSLAHSFSGEGFSGDNFRTSAVADYELPVLPICGFRGKSNSASYSTSDETNYSIVYNPTNSVTYSFGYAIRGTVIESFYRTSQYGSNTGWNWSIIGNILQDGSVAYYSYYFSGGEKDTISSSYYPIYSCQPCAFSVIGYDKKPFPASDISTNNGRYPRLSPSVMPNRCNTSAPSELFFSACCLSLCHNNGTIYTESSAGIDGNGSCCAGLINTDVLRTVAASACQVGGAIYQGGNFVVPCAQPYISNSDDFGILLGWDPSNESIV